MTHPPARWLLVLAAMLAAAGCAKRESNVARGTRDQVLHLGNLAEPTDLDPHIVTAQQDFAVVMNLFEGLTAYDPRDLHPVPGVAERWETSADGLRWVFHLRADAKWSNGEPVTAADFVYGFRRVLSPKLGAAYAYLLFSLKNAEAYHRGELTDFAQVGVAAVDARTLELTLTQPLPYLPALAAHSAWMPVHRATIEANGKIDQRGTNWTKPEHLIGNGPFILTAWKPNQYIRIQRSPTYWDRNAVKLKEAWIYPIENENTEEAAFRAGQLHVTAQIPSEKIAQYKTAQPRTLIQSPTLGSYFYRFNTTKPPLSDARVRRALAMAINRPQLTERVTLGGEVPAGSLTPPDMAGFTARASISDDVATAQRLLAAAGFPEGRGFPVLELSFNTTEKHRHIAEAIQQMWRRNLGINVTLLNREAKVHEDAMRQLNYDIARYGWFGDYLDPSTFLEIMTSDSGNNLTGWKNAAYDRQIALSHATPDNAVRYECFQECERILAQDAPLLPLFTYMRNYLVRPEVRGWYPTLLDLHPLKDVYLEP